MSNKDIDLSNIENAPAPKGKYAFGSVTVGEKGQIVIPKRARDVFGIKSGDTLFVFGDDAQHGIGIIREEELLKVLHERSIM